MTVQPSGGDARGDAEVAAAVLVDVFARDRRAVRLRAAARDERVAAHVARLRDERLLVGVAVRDELRRPGATTSAKPCSPMRMRSTIRHISSRLNSPTSQPAGWFEAREMDREDRGRQQVVVDADRRHRHAVDA